ncbi:MAG: hypothetical protein IH794_01070 [Acidobacteria bacterium]|nr:hypothetical protein [Acidobacteriota bacterium]
MPAIEEVAKKYDDAELWHLYVREPHPQERKFKKYFPHKNYEDRIAYAQELREVMNIESPIVLDGMDEKIHLRYGNMPNAVYVVDKKGNVVYKANWTDAPVVDEVLAELRDKEQTTDNRQLTKEEDGGQKILGTFGTWNLKLGTRATRAKTGRKS